MLPHEEAIVTPVLKSMDAEPRDCLKKQLQQDFFMERIPDGRINIFRFYKQPKDLKFTDKKFEDLIYKVKVTVDGKKQTAQITFYQGFIFSIELRQPKKHYTGKTLTINKVFPAETAKSYTEAIDKEEHGDEGL